MPKRFNPFTQTFDYFSGSTYTGDLVDSASNKIADVVSGEMTNSIYNIQFLLQENSGKILQENGDEIKI